MPEETISPAETLALYISGPDRLQAVLAGLSEMELDSCCAPGEWTIRKIVHHLADGDDIWSMCIKVALGAPGSSLLLRLVSWKRALGGQVQLCRSGG
jgi:hypothetical protein